MTKQAHTPGPWIAAAKPSSFVGWPVVGPMGRSIANVSYHKTPGTPFNEQAAEAEAQYRAECEANARLIAAAPDLLEALEELVGEDLCGDVNPDNATRETEFYRPVISWAMRHRARTAIAKARGE